MPDDPYERLRNNPQRRELAERVQRSAPEEPALIAEAVRGRTYLVRIEVEIPVGPHDDWESLEDWLGDKVAWDVRHCDFLGGIASVNVVEHLDHGELNDGSPS